MHSIERDNWKVFQLSPMLATVNMNSKIIKISMVAMIVLTHFSTMQCFAAETPKEVVTRFCKLDFEGHRLSSASYSQIAPLVMYPDEPGWDTVLGVHKYEIVNQTIEGNAAKVTVRYEIDRSWPYEIEIVNKLRNGTFNLNQENGTWKISKCIGFPRVSSQYLCIKYKFCSTGS